MFSILFQLTAYPMDRPRLGKAYIINNVAREYPGSMEDVKELQATYETMGFEVLTHLDCSNRVTQFVYFSCICLITVHMHLPE